MPRTRLFPLRHNVGDRIQVHIAELRRAPECGTGYQLRAEPVGGVDGLQNHPALAEFLPGHLSLPGIGVAATPTDGYLTMPPHPDLPFAPEDGFHLLSMQGGMVEEDISRRLWIEFEVTIGEKSDVLIGGLCYGGCPYLPYYNTPQGETSSNFGLPRELRVSWEMSGGASGFLDGETGITVQQPAAHSGIHVLPIGPISARRLVLRLSDFPRIPLIHRGVSDQQRPYEVWGFLMPYLYVYAHREQTRWRPRVPAALVACQQTPPNLGGTYYWHADPSGPMRGTCPDQVRAVPGAEPRFAVLSAASIFGAGRTYLFDAGDEAEFFLSGALNLNDKVLFFIEQTEQHERTIAGLRLGFVKHRAMKDFVVEVFESDPAEGVSPVRLDADPMTDKYTKGLYRGEFRDTEFPDDIGVFRFVRPSNSRYFVIVITCLEPQGRVALFRAELVQSASVALTSRPSRRQHVQAIRYRLYGAEIGSDYSRLSEQGFRISVEHSVAGQQRRVLFEASTLLELVESGTAQILRNQRYMETTREVSDLQTKTKGWRQSETGEGVHWAPGYQEDIDPSVGDESPILLSYFRSYSTTETRVHTRHIGFVGDEEEDEFFQDQIKTINAGIQQVAGSTQSKFVLFPTSSTNPMLSWMTGSASNTGFSWKGVDTTKIRQVRGLYHLNVPPFSLPTNLVSNVLTLLMHNPALPPPQELLETIARDSVTRGILSGFTASMGASLSFVLGGSLSLSSGQMLPSASRVATSGESGTIQVQGTSVGYQFNRHLNENYDRTRQVRQVLKKDEQRRKGGDVQWQGEIVDIVTGVIPAGIHLPATANDIYRTTDELILVRFNLPPESDIRVDIWFDVIEEPTRDDH